MDSRTCSILAPASFRGLIGVAQQDITPPVGIYCRSWGAAKHDVAEGIHRPLTLTCLTFQSAMDEPPLVLMGADLGWWKSAEDEWFLRSEILNALSLKPSQLMFCLSHTHAGPSLCREDISRPGGRLIEPYLRQLQDSAICAVRCALATTAPAVLTWRYGKCDLAANRDLPETSGGRFLVGFNPAQKADDTLLVGRVTDEKKRIIATIVNYACHPTTLAWENRLLSPDYIGAMRELVSLQTQAPCLFLQGASGELAPAEQYVSDVALADAYGRQLGHAVLGTLEGMPPPKTHLAFSGVVESGAPLAIWKRSNCEPSVVLSAEAVNVELPLKPLPPLAEIERQWRECEDRIFKERLWRQRAVRKAVGGGEFARVPLWVWRLGDSLLVGQPNETYSEFQEEIRRQMMPNPVAVMNIANGYVGYLPPRKLYGQNLYSVWQTPFQSGALELLTQRAAEVARRVMGA